jgi:hypothetical protein
MDFSSINWLVVIVCTVVSMVIGAVWYNPKTFFPGWWKAMGKGDYDPSGGGEAGMGGGGGAGMGMVWGLTIFSAFLRALFLSLIVPALGGATLVAGATIGFFLWLGITAPTSRINKLFAGHFKSWFYETGDHLVTLVVIGAIVGAWQ